MLNRCLSIVLILVFLMAAGVQAQEIGKELTDVPASPTQDAVLEMNSVWDDGLATPYDHRVMPNDELTTRTDTDAYQFVYEEGNRPVRFYPEETQIAIEELLDGVNPDALYMTELMRLNGVEADPSDPVDVKMLFDVDYQVGQLVIVVVGDITDPDNIVWTPLKAEVTDLGRVEYTIPTDLMEQIEGEDHIFTLLTVRKGQRGGVVEYKKETISNPLPSKTANDIVRITKVVTPGNDSTDSFQLIVTEESKRVLDELRKLSDHVDEMELPAVTYFPPEVQDEIQLFLEEGFDRETLKIYDYLALITKDYDIAYGDASAVFTFATPYEPGQQIVTVLGLPIPEAEAVNTDETLMTWDVQRAIVNARSEVEVLFDQQSLFGMGEDTGLLLVLSEPFPEEIPEE